MLVESGDGIGIIFSKETFPHAETVIVIRWITEEKVLNFLGERADEFSAEMTALGLCSRFSDAKIAYVFVVVVFEICLHTCLEEGKGELVTVPCGDGGLRNGCLGVLYQKINKHRRLCLHGLHLRLILQ